MSATHEFHRVQLDSVTIPTDRQREKPRKVEELADSIKRIGLIHPITITRMGVLVTGGCRLAAYKMLAANDPSSLKWKLISAQYVDELGPEQLKLIELEENIKRSDLTWQEESVAVLRYYIARGEEYTVADLAQDIGMGKSAADMRVTVAKALLANDVQVKACETMGAAHNVLKRRMSRAIDEEVALLMDTEEVAVDISLGDLNISELDIETVEAAPTQEEEEAAVAAPRGVVPAIKMPAGAESYVYKAPETVLKGDYEVVCGDYFELIREYDGPKFNFLHTDFPYGINHDKSDQGKSLQRGSYSDAPDVFWQFLDALFDNQDRILTASCHVMVWFSMPNYHRLKTVFENVGFFVNPYPLIWYKSDKIGIVPDVNRRPRQVYESALLMTRGDRKLVKALPNVSDAPANKRRADHISEKPTLALIPFFKMLVDESTKMLDPTCGSGGSLSTAISLGASYVRGWELDKFNANGAKTKVYSAKTFPLLKSAAEESNDAEIEEEEDFEESEADAGSDELGNTDSEEEADWDAQGPSDEELQAIEAGKISVDDLEI